MKTAAIVIPTYNEAGNIEKLVHEIIEVSAKVPNWDLQMLVVDSRSSDKTGAIVRDLQKQYKNLHLLETEKEGLGKAYVRGFTYVLERMQAYVMFEMDADMSHDPKKIVDFLHHIEKGSDFVIGSRYTKGGSIPSDWGIHRKLFSVLGNWIIRLGFMNMKITDWTSGYRAVKVWIIKAALPHISNYSGYVFQLALLENALRHHARISEVPIHIRDRTHGESKIHFSSYIFQIFAYIFKYSSFIKFVIVGGAGFILDFGISYILIHPAHFPLWLATVISTESAIISNFLFNNYWSFAHKKLEHHPKTMLFNFLKFNLVSSGSIIIQTLGIVILSRIFSPDLWFVYKFFIIIFVVIPYSYILYNKIIWKDKK